MTDKRFVVSLFPHVHSGRSVARYNGLTIVGLLPALGWGIYQFGIAAGMLVCAAVIGAVAVDIVVGQIVHRPKEWMKLHAVLVGLTVALLLPSGAPIWMAFMGGALAIAIGKAPFGPQGGSPLSPALVGILIVALSWPGEITNYEYSRSIREEARAAANLGTVEMAAPEAPQDAAIIDPSEFLEYDTLDLFLGHQVGSIGTISPLLLILGGLLLIGWRVIHWQAPMGFIFGMAVFSAIAYAVSPGLNATPVFHLLTGTAMFGAFFLCTEPTSTPSTPWGMFLFGAFAGALVLLLRTTGMPMCRVIWALAIAQLATPLFDRIVPIPFGKVVNHA